MKKFFALLLALTMVLSLVACGGSNDAAESTDDAATEETAEKVTLDVIAAQYGTQTADWWVGFEADFEAANENIDLVVDVVSWNDI